MKKRELSMLIAGGLVASFMLNTAQAVMAEELKASIVNESIKGDNDDFIDYSNIDVLDSQVVKGTQEEFELQFETEPMENEIMEIHALEEDTNSDCIYFNNCLTIF